MTVGELVEAATFCDCIEVVVREEGCRHWLQGYRVGKDVDVYPSEYSVEYLEEKQRYMRTYGKEMPKMRPSEIRDLRRSRDLPIKVIKKDVHRLPEKIANLQVYDFQPRHIPSYHKEQLTHNDFSMDINAYPEGWEPERVEKPKTEAQDELEGQMSFDDLIKDKADEN